MKPIGFPEQNKILQKPEIMIDDECGPLPIWNDGNECVSCWRPSIKERLSILLFGRIWLSVLSGETQPPVLIWARRNGFGALLESE